MLVAIAVTGEERNKHDNEMYTLHLARVWINVREAGGDETQQAIAWLHDAVEDGHTTYTDIRNVFSGFDALQVDRLIGGLQAISKVQGETNADYLVRCRANADARFVKLRGDTVDNFRRTHNIEDFDKKARMMNKYSLTVDALS